jgi:FKBP12-rapamycin complex-associated protein
VAIDVLMKILREPALSQHHNKVILAVMFIFNSLGMKCVPFLPQLIPPFLNVMRTHEDSLRESLFNQLGVLVRTLARHLFQKTCIYSDSFFAKTLRSSGKHVGACLVS